MSEYEKAYGSLVTLANEIAKSYDTTSDTPISLEKLREYVISMHESYDRTGQTMREFEISYGMRRSLEMVLAKLERGSPLLNRITMEPKKEKQRWTPINESNGLPTDGHEVLIRTKQGYATQSRIENGTWVYHSPEDITHWSELPTL